MQYIALDIGNKRVGIAISQENIAFPHVVIPRTELISYLKKYFLKHWKEFVIIVGLPYDLYGKNLTQLEKTQKFIQKLQWVFSDVSIIGHDERFSSFVAGEGFWDHRDDIAAQCILQSYIDTLNK